jgi:hypothetical protein
MHILVTEGKLLRVTRGINTMRVITGIIPRETCLLSPMMSSYGSPSNASSISSVKEML